MKKLLLVLFFITAFSKSKSQVVFCPPGASWNYEFTVSIWDFYARVNEKIYYWKDSINGLDTFKVLGHVRFFRQCNMSISSPTLLKQSGDTIFFKNNRTQNSWQILYNFACGVGQGWQTTITTHNSTTPVTYSYTVDSSYYVNINGFNLKRLKVFVPTLGYAYITERFGSSQFLFNYRNTGGNSCDADKFVSFLCYSDSVYGTEVFTQKPCNYSNPTGLNDLNSFSSASIFPNPANDSFVLSTELSEDLTISLTDMYGRKIKHIQIKNNEKVSVSDLSKGIYLLKILKEKEVVYKTKLIKE